MATVIIDLPDENAAVLHAKATERGLTVEQYARQVLEYDLKSGKLARPHISKIIRERMSKVPPEIMAIMPADGASQHDHYIYGLPKRSVKRVFADTFYWIALTDSTDAQPRFAA